MRTRMTRRALVARSARLSDYTSDHEAAINTAKAEAEALLGEYVSLDLKGLEVNIAHTRTC